MKRESIGRAVSEAPSYKWRVFGIIAMSTSMTVLEEVGVLIALPKIESHFGVDLPTVQWMVVGYILAISIFLLPMGRLGDIVGRKQVFVAGLVTFVLGASLAGFATTIVMLIMARVLLGAGTAMTMGNGMAMLTSTFSRGEWGKALGYRMGIVGTAAVVGPVLGGFLVTTFGWRSIFLFTIAYGLITIITAIIVLDKGRLTQDAQVGARPRFDWLGAAFSGGALLALILALAGGSRIGWGSPLIWAGMLFAAVLLASFIWWELRTPSPMLELRLFRRKRVGLGVASAWILFLGVFQLMFMMSFYLQKVLGYSAQAAGLILIPNFIAVMIVGPLAGRLSDRFGWRKFNIGGMALSAAALFVFSFTLTEDSSLSLIIPVLILHSCGIGLFDSANNASILSGVERSRLGVVASLTQLTRNSAGVTSVAVATAIVVATMASMGVEPRLDAVSAEGGREVAQAFVSGLHRSFMIMGILMLVGIMLSYLKGDRPKVSPEGGSETPTGANFPSADAAQSPPAG